LLRLWRKPQQTIKSTLRSGSGYNHNKQQNPLFVQALDITTTNNKTHSSFRLWI
jgi:hypothetical protein